MPTEKPRVTITMTDEQLKEIETYRYGRKMKNQTQAILSLIERGFDALAADNPSSAKKTAQLYSSEAARMAKDNAMTKEEIIREKMVSDYGSVLKFSEQTGIPYSTIRNIFSRGFETLSAGVAVEICKRLKIDMESIMDGSLSARPNAQNNNTATAKGEKMELGEYIAKYRKEAGVTLDDLAARSGVPKGTINKIIAGTTKSPTLETVCSIANALGKTINDFMDPPQGSKKTAPLYSSEAAKIAKDYDSLDHWGKAAVRSVADTELARMQDEARFLAETSMEQEPKVINLFTDPSAAGPALGITGQSCEPYTLTPDDPQGAAYAVRVQGDSMEPDFPDGSIAFVNHDQMRDGDIGVFCVDGATVIKQWHYDPVLGITYLFSLNRKRNDCDLVIMNSSNRSIVWQGRVLTRRRYDLPGMV